MKKITVIAMAIGLVLVFSQTQAQNANYRRYQAKGRNYNPATVETVKGKVDLVETFAAKRGGGIHITVSAGKENVRVALGPAWFINEKMTIARGDEVQVVGSRISNMLGEKLIVAKTITKGSVELVLRSDQGVPVWAGQGRGRRGR